MFFYMTTKDHKIGNISKLQNLAKSTNVDLARSWNVATMQQQCKNNQVLVQQILNSNHYAKTSLISATVQE